MQVQVFCVFCLGLCLCVYVLCCSVLFCVCMLANGEIDVTTWEWNKVCLFGCMFEGNKGRQGKSISIMMQCIIKMEREVIECNWINKPVAFAVVCLCKMCVCLSMFTRTCFSVLFFSISISSNNSVGHWA